MAGEDEESRDRIAAGNFKKLGLSQDEFASNVDMLNEIFKHLDAASLAMASCVSKKWKQGTDNEGHWEAICTRHWPSTPSSQTGQLKTVIVAFGGFRRFFVKYLHPLLSRNNSSLKHLNSFSISNGGLSSCKQKWSKDEVYLSLSLFSIDRFQKIAPLSLHSSRMAGILCKQQPASSSDVGHLLDGWRDKYCSSDPSNRNNKKISVDAEDAKYCWGSMDSQSSSK